MLEFQKVCLSDKALLNSFLSDQPALIAEHFFTTLYAWQKSHAYEWAVYEKWLLLKTTWQEHVSFFPPIGCKKDYQRPVAAALTWLKANRLPAAFSEVTAADLYYLQKALPVNFTVRRDRANANYIYRVEDLIGLKGRAYHQKRNHIANFRRNWPQARFLPLSASLLPDCLAALDRWEKYHPKGQFPSLRQEINASRLILEGFGDLDYVGACVMIDKQVEAFTIGEKSSAHTAVIHIEKANTEIPGLYAFINQRFLAEYFTDCVFVNRAEDVGEPNLRKAKLSYHPCCLLMKYILEEK